MMTRRCMLVLCGLAFSRVCEAQPAVAGNPRVELKGRIQSVQLARGQGMPSVIVKTGDATARVYLGSMRYLMEQNFNPKAGAEVVVKGYKINEDVYAITVTLTADNRVLQLRDENGRPVWQGGRYGRKQ